MASLYKLPILVILISSILCFFSSCSIIVHEDLLTKACTDTDKIKICTEILKNDKAVTAAATKELDLGLAIMKSTLAHTKETHDYLLKKKRVNPAYTDCEKGWFSMVDNLKNILERTTKNKGYKEDTDDYDFKVVGDAIGVCGSGLTRKKIVDPELTRRGDIVRTLISAADKPLTDLRRKTQNRT
ncbi:hypothetical protein FXO38_16421 [Capsicum annuum]|uniref:Pectinesterase inhibitor domain-containing protein n=1 Tax=Capsicum annuum TaxID=4072 RepID=A0A1U8F2K3_CAPAN|nr:uncharacterized protein LOC107849845 [Capsicum annuum]KAF3651822.1 hypothetical protein FXO38_16421 [Capsicum annuum]KAF3676649.1 hypothetical protein FXO37_05214 [Capsicum annuum]PHT66168.1 hypothetical protein T459_30593 [Capsicum annuum]